MKKQFIIELDMPAGVSMSDMKEHIRVAVGSMTGCLHPDDPLFELDRDSVSVRTLTSHRLKKLTELSEEAGGYEELRDARPS